MEDPSISPGRGGKRTRKRFFKLFLRDRSGAAAIEFAALAIPFLLLAFAILESCISFAGQEVMANATDDVARLMRTGQIKKSDNIDETKLKGLICERMSVIVAKGCPGLMVDLRHFDTFDQAAKARFSIVGGNVVLTNDGAPDQFRVDPGLSTTKNMLRVFYKWPVMIDFMARSMANLNDGNTLHFASITWQNEPFDD